MKTERLGTPLYPGDPLWKGESTVEVHVDVSCLDGPGKYILVPDDDLAHPFGDVFLCRVRFPGDLPAGSIRVAENECILAFSRRCTHLSCHLVPGAPGSSGVIPREDGVVSCPCHFSTFDLTQQGIPVIGPATAFLPQVELVPLATAKPETTSDIDAGIVSRIRRVISSAITTDAPEPVKQVRLVRWIRDKSVPYGVPFGGTSNRPSERP